MRKHRSWWMGFGLGIVLGAILLQLINVAVENDRTLMNTDVVRTYTQEELDKAVEEAVRKAQLTSAQPSASGSDGGNTALTPNADSPDRTTKTLEDRAQPDANDGDAVHIVAFYVNKNMSLLTVARSLQALGVIEDAEDFTQAARSVSKRIAIGTAVFSGKPTYEEIIAELTRLKDD